MQENRKRKVFVVDDHPLVREWLANLLNLQADLQVCGEAGNAAEGLKQIAATRPHAAIVDISMRGGSGINLIKEIKSACPEVAVIVLSMHDEWLYGERALRAGACAYVVKQDATRNVLQAVRCGLEGKLYISEKLAGIMADRLAIGKPAIATSLNESLSDRELQVFQLIGSGCSTRKIAEEMRISFKTVQAFSARIKEKLHLSSATELLREAIRWHDRQHLQ